MTHECTSSASTSSRSRTFTSLPVDCLLHCMRVFMTHPDLIAIGSTSHFLRTTTTQCDLPPTVSRTIDHLIRVRSYETEGLVQALPEVLRNRLRVLCEKGQKPENHQTQQNSKAEENINDQLRPSYQIGRLTAIEITHYLKAKMLKSLVLPYLDRLPPAIKCIQIAGNVELSACRFPSHLTRLHFKSPFAGDVESFNFPPNLRELIFDRNGSFRIEMEKMRLPESLRVLHVGGTAFQASIERLVLPNQLTELQIFTDDRARKQSIAHLRLPHGLTRLDLDFHFVSSPDFVHQLPPTLTHLKLNSSLGLSLEDWIPPPSLRRLECSSRCRLPGDVIIHVLPVSCLTFTLPDRTQSATLVPINFAKYLTHINEPDTSCLHDCWNSDTLIPDSVTSLRLSALQPIACSLPSSLKEFSFGEEYNQSILTMIFPSNLTQLEFGLNFSQDIDLPSWPPALKYLSFVCPPWFKLSYRRPPRFLPRTMQQIDLYRATDEWLQLDLPPTCLFYELEPGGLVRTGRSRFSLVDPSRVESARAKLVSRISVANQVLHLTSEDAKKAC